MRNTDILNGPRIAKSLADITALFGRVYLEDSNDLRRVL